MHHVQGRDRPFPWRPHHAIVLIILSSQVHRFPNLTQRGNPYATSSSTTSTKRLRQGLGLHSTTTNHQQTPPAPLQIKRKSSLGKENPAGVGSSAGGAGRKHVAPVVGPRGWGLRRSRSRPTTSCTVERTVGTARVARGAGDVDGHSARHGGARVPPRPVHLRGVSFLGAHRSPFLSGGFVRDGWGN